MRQELSKKLDKRLTFFAEVDRYGTKTNYKGYPEKTICFRNVTFADGRKATDHIWFTMGKRLASLGEMEEGDKVTFEARVATYRKGYFKEGITIDYKLSNPTKLKRINENIK